jgi:hypothetical protein
LQEEGGVNLYDRRSAFEAFIPQNGVQGTLSQDESIYIASLIAAASDQGKVAVLTCTRTLGRVGGLKEAFSGTHLLIYRNLYHQWLSYCSLSTKGQRYFLRTTYLILANNQHDPFFAYLATAYMRPEDEAVVDADQIPDIDQRAFVIFFGVHLYLYLSAMPAADIILDISRLARDPDYRSELADEIEKASGIPIDLDSVRERIEYFDVQLGDIRSLRDCLQSLLGKAVECCDAALSKSELLALGDRLVGDAVNEIERSNLYFGAARAHFDGGVARGPSLAEQAAIEELGRARVEHARLSTQFQALSEEFDRAVLAREAALHDRDAILASTTWRLTAPLRALGEVIKSIGYRTSRGTGPHSNDDLR